MSDTGADFSIEADVTVDSAAMDALGDRLAKELRDAGLKGSADFNRVLARTLDTLRRNLGRSLGTLGPELTAAGQRATKTLKGAADEAGRMREDIKAMSLLLEAQQNNRFIDPNQFALLRRLQAGFLETQRIIAKTDFSNPAAVRASRAALDTQRRLINSANITLQSTVKQSTAQIIEEERRRTLAARTEATRRSQLARSEAVEANAIVRRQQDQILVATQRAARQRVQITRFALESLGRAEKAFGALVTGIARTTSSAVSRLYGDSFGRVSQLIRRQSSQINSITRSSTSERTSILRSGFRQQERLVQQSMTRQTEIIRAAQARAQTGVVGVARRSSLLGVGGGVAGLGVLSLGLERFSNLERLTKQFEALTGSATDASTVLEQVKEFARATPFDLVGVADLAKGFLAIKTPIDQVLPRVRAIADAVALTGGGVDELNRIQRAIGQVVSAGRLQGDELNQLAENLPGLNIRQILADQLTGGNVAALVELQEAGKISGDAFVDGLITGLANDVRLQGASEDLAKTLGGRLANLKEVVADVGASFIGLIADPLKEATKVATIALDGLSQFIKGEISPAMQVLRTAIGGAAGAIGLLLVAKVAGESLKILASGARLLLTPFGLVIAAVGAVGAAIAVMRDRSEEFREVTDRLVRFLQTTVGNVWTAIGDQVTRVQEAFAKAKEPITGTADALERSLTPARSWISEVGTRLAGAIATAGRFLTETLIPALGDFAIFVGRNAGPALSAFRDILEDLGTRAADLARRGFERIEPVLVRIGEFAREVAAAIREVVDGAASLKTLIPTGAAILGGGLIAGPIGALVAGAAVGFATLSPTIRGFIVDGFTTAMDSVKSFFARFDWGDLAVGALEFVRRVGRIIGTIVSSREFVTAVLAIGAAAVAVGVKFVQGFAEGVISNLDELADLGLDIGEVILEGFADFISDPSNMVTALGGLSALFAGSQLLGAFRSRGQEAGQSFISGFRSNATAGGDLLSSVMFGRGGPNAFINQSVRSASRAAQATANEVRRQLSTFSRAAGGEGVLSIGTPNAADIKRAAGQMDLLTKAVGTGAAAGLRLRTAFSDAFASIRSNSTGIRGIFSSLSTGVGDAAAALKGQGAAIGSALGVGVVAGFSSAVSGQQLGSGNLVGGLGGILASSIGAGLVAGPAIGVAVGALGLLSAAWTSTKQAAEAFSEAVRGVADALTDVGAIAGDAAAQALQGVIGDQLKNEAAETKNALADAGITAEFLADQLIRIGPSGSAAIKAAGETARAFAVQFENGAGGLERFSDVGEGIPSILERIASVSPETADALQRLVRAAEDGTISGETFKNAVDELFDNIDESGPGISDAAANIRVLGDAAKDASISAADLFEARLMGTGLNAKFEAPKNLADELKVSVEETQKAVDKLLNPNEGTLQAELADAALALESIAGSIGGGIQLGGVLGGAQVQSSLDDLRRNLSGVVQEGIEDGAAEAEIDNALGLLKIGIDQLDVPEDVKALMRAEVEAAINADTIPVDVEAVANTESAQQAARDLVSAAEGEITGNELDGAGEDVGAGFAEGLRNALGRVQSAARALAGGAEDEIRKRTGAQSPATVYIGIGGDVGDGFAIGVLDSIPAVVEVAGLLGDSFREATMESLERLEDDIAALGPTLFDSLLGGVSDRDAALRGVQGTLRSFTDDLAGPLQEALENGLPKNFSIDFGVGLDNRNAFADVVAGLKEFGANLLRSGSSAEEVQSVVLLKREEALNIASFLGFDRAVVEDFFNGLGLSAAGLQEFGRRLAEETEELKKATTLEEATRIQEEIDRRREEREREREEEEAVTETPTIGELNVSLALPFGDPEAIGLSVANRAVAVLRTR